LKSKIILSNYRMQSILIAYWNRQI